MILLEKAVVVLGTEQNNPASGSSGCFGYAHRTVVVLGIPIHDFPLGHADCEPATHTVAAVAMLTAAPALQTIHFAHVNVFVANVAKKRKV